MRKGLKKMLRVTEGKIVLLTWVGYGSDFWLLVKDTPVERKLAAGNHRYQEDLRPVGDLRFAEVRAGNILVVHPNYGILIPLLKGGQDVGHGHSFGPGPFPLTDGYHWLTPFWASTCTTSSKSIRSRLAVACVGMPSVVQPRRS